MERTTTIDQKPVPIVATQTVRAMNELELQEKAKKIKFLVLDADGIMTDGKIYYGNYGDEIKAFDVKDGLGIVFLKGAGIDTAIITAKKSRIVRFRAKDLGIRYVYENSSKLATFNKLLKRFGLTKDEVCFMGDDIIDIPVLKNTGLSVTVPQAADEVKAAASHITKANAGSGAVREICELILKSQDKWEEVTKKYFV